MLVLKSSVVRNRLRVLPNAKIAKYTLNAFKYMPYDIENDCHVAGCWPGIFKTATKTSAGHPKMPWILYLGLFSVIYSFILEIYDLPR